MNDEVAAPRWRIDLPDRLRQAAGSSAFLMPAVVPRADLRKPQPKSKDGRAVAGLSALPPQLEKGAKPTPGDGQPARRSGPASMPSQNS